MYIKLSTFLEPIIILLFTFLPVDKVFSQDTTDCRQSVENFVKQNRKNKKQKVIIKGVSTDVIEGKRLKNLVFTFSKTSKKLILVEFHEVDESNKYQNFNVLWLKNDSLLAVRHVQLGQKTKAWGTYFFDHEELCYKTEHNLPVQDFTKFVKYSKTFLTEAYKKLQEMPLSKR